MLSIFSQKIEKAPNTSRLFNKAMSLADKGNYNSAIETFKVILERDSQNLDALFNLGLCYLNTSNSADTAVVCFKDGLSKLTEDEDTSYIGNEFRLSLAEAYQVILEPNKSIQLYNEILEHITDSDSALQTQVHKKIEICKNAAFFIKNPIEIEIENLGSNVNSMYDDHSPLVGVSEDELIFTSRRKWIKVPLLEDGQYSEKIYAVSLDKNNWEAAKVLQIFFRQYEHESAASLSPDGEKLVLFRNDEHGKSLYWSKFNGEEWSEPEKFPEPINSYYEETHGALSADMSSFYFTSDRPGGYGGLDIYLCRKDANGNWGDPINLGPEINSPYDEETPQIHYDGRTLYFSSEGHNSMGKLDVFYSELQKDSIWIKPVNMGFPINTPDDDFFFTPTINKNRAYYASSRFADNYGGSDIYTVHFKNNTNNELVVVEGVIDEELGNDFAKMRVLVTRTQDNQLVGDYRPDDNNGKYMLFLEIGYEYEVTQKNLELEKTKYIEAKPELSYIANNQAVAFTNVAMSAPLKRFENKVKAAFVEMTNTLYKNDSTSTELAQIELDTPKTEIRVQNIELTNAEEVIESGYTIQIFALKKKPIADKSIYKNDGISILKEYVCKDGYTRYTFGQFDSYDETLKAKMRILNSGLFEDLWIRPNKDLQVLKQK